MAFYTPADKFFSSDYGNISVWYTFNDDDCWYYDDDHMEKRLDCGVSNLQEFVYEHACKPVDGIRILVESIAYGNSDACKIAVRDIAVTY